VDFGDLPELPTPPKSGRMRWSIIRLIWLREMRDQLRDRRTVLMIVGLPLVLYPVLGLCVLTFAMNFFDKPSRIGIVRPAEEPLEFPQRTRQIEPASVAAIIGYASQPSFAAAVAVPISSAHIDDAPLVRGKSFKSPFARRDGPMSIDKRLEVTWYDSEAMAAEALEAGKVDLVLSASPDFYADLRKAEMGIEVRPSTEEMPAGAFPPGRATIRVKFRQESDAGEHALLRLRGVLDKWRIDLKKVRFVRRGLDAAFDSPFDLDEPKSPHSETDPLKLVEMVIRVFPFMLVMWALAGALYPAVDLCAGEKERGTLETLLISPAGREEIVLGKFLTIWVFSVASALLNLASMGLTTARFGAILPAGSFPIASLFWCILLSLPLCAFFSAISLAIGAYARSSKEGQYYLMPLFLLTMPLIFITLAPGVELSPFYSLVPVTGVALLMQKLMLSPGSPPWLYFVPVLAPIAIYSGLALRWAIDQFQREEVLFREAERLDIKLWLQRALQEKTATATPGQATFCFALLLVLAWLSAGLGGEVAVRHAVIMLAFVATPPMLMAILLNQRPIQSLRLRWPRWNDIGFAVGFAALLVPAIVWGRHDLLRENPQLEDLLGDVGAQVNLSHLIAFGLLPTIAEELAFRGFILTGLRKRYRPRTAVMLCAFLGALFHMNVFRFVPIFGMGVLLGLLTLRSGSVLPGMLLRLLAKTVFLCSLPVGDRIAEVTPGWLWMIVVAITASLAATAAWNLFWRVPVFEEKPVRLPLPASGRGPG
jgi:sodium transport system permease protein